MLRILLLIAVLLAAWEAGFWLVAGVKPLSPWGLAGELEAAPAPLLVDVRTLLEYRMFHIDGALHHPEVALGKIPPELAQADRDLPVVLICMTGHRSSIAGARLKEAGFANVSSLTGGTLGWVLTGHPVESGPPLTKAVP